jgi:hypothetical protein
MYTIMMFPQHVNLPPGHPPPDTRTQTKSGGLQHACGHSLIPLACPPNTGAPPLDLLIGCLPLHPPGQDLQHHPNGLCWPAYPQLHVNGHQAVLPPLLRPPPAVPVGCRPPAAADGRLHTMASLVPVARPGVNEVVIACADATPHLVFAAFARRRSLAEVQRLMAPPEAPAAAKARVDATVRRLLQEQARQEAQEQQQLQERQAAPLEDGEDTPSSSTGSGVAGKSSSRQAPQPQAASAAGGMTAAPDGAVSDMDAAASADSGAVGSGKAAQGAAAAGNQPLERKVGFRRAPTGCVSHACKCLLGTHRITPIHCNPRSCSSQALPLLQSCMLTRTDLDAYSRMSTSPIQASVLHDTMHPGVCTCSCRC